MKIAKVQTEDRNINQLQQNIAQAVEPLLSPVSGSFVFTLTGFATNPSGVAKYYVDSLSGAVTLMIPSTNATSNSDAMSMTGLPAILFPATAQTWLISVNDNGVGDVGMFALGTDGSINIFRDVNETAFTTSGSKGLSGMITYWLYL